MRISQIAAVMILLLGPYLSLRAQSVSIALDRDSLLIGQQVEATISVQAAPESSVLFPEGQTFTPVEVIKMLATDTLAERPQLLLEKKYLLSIFDPGEFTIVPQQVTINKRPFLTPELRLYVKDVAVDTTQQGLYDIKSFIKVENPNSSLPFILAVLAIILIGIAAYLLYKRYRKKALTVSDPFEQTLAIFQSLKAPNGAFETHQTYFKATVAFKHYITSRLGISANERTSAELLLLLDQLNERNDYELSVENLTQLRKTLERSDLAKFANLKVEAALIREDIDLFIRLTTQFEEKKKAEIEALEIQPKQRQSKKKRVLALSAVVLLLLLSFGVLAFQVGLNDALDTLTLNASKRMYEREWVQSSYGFPPVQIESPEALLRKESEFVYTKENIDFQLIVRVALDETQAELDFRSKSEAQLNAFEDMGYNNIIPKGELFSSSNDIQGYRSHGTATNSNKEFVHFEHLIFGGPKFSQEIIIVGQANDRWADRAIDRIIESIKVSTEL